MWWTVWWVWAVAALVLGILETLAPAYVFLGLACGAAVMALVAAFGFVSLSMPASLVLFAILSLIAVVVLRRLLGVRDGQVKVWDTDINE